MPTKVLSFEFGGRQVRAIRIGNQPWFVLADLCAPLGLTTPKRVARHLGDEMRLTHPVPDSLGRNQNTTLVNEPGMYEAILQSNEPRATAFRHWITNTVLPQIRETGAHHRTVPLSDDQIVVQALEITSRRLRELQDQIAALESKARFADAVSSAKTTVLISDLAKVLHANGLAIGQNRLFAWLRRDGFLIQRQGTDYNMPTQKSMELGLFEIKETVIEHSDGPATLSKTPKVTGKGQTYLYDFYMAKHESKAS